ncbi:MAG TPA: ribosomal protein S18-alanine N-acetyltransferase [Mycobacteriales bacterium]|nr:ribosomal protein S18-alanine N-acetyltransferase [Mycobacteriales bacterium]
MVTLERFRWWHVEQVLPVERQLFEPEPWTAQHFWTELGQTDTRHYLVALDGAELVGYAGYCDYPDEGFVQTLGVAPRRQREGIGTLLLDALLAHAATLPHKAVSLEVRADNEAAQRLYETRGFRRAGVRRGYYAGGVDALVLTRP